MKRVYNFSAGPAMLPDAVMKQAESAFFNFNETGMSIMEIGHRTELFMPIAERSEALLRSLLSIPDNYHVLFLHGGASSQFSMVPLNCLGAKKSADYIDTGIWSGKAIKEAKRYGQVNIATSSASSDFTTVPDQASWQLDPNAAYVHYTPNETINGLEFLTMPDFGEVPVVADMSSTLLSRPIDINKFSLIYAGAQKNLGPSGITIVIVRDDFIQTPLPMTPGIFRYRDQIESQSMYNTPTTWAWYLVSLVFEWVQAQGGVQSMGVRNQIKAQKLYQAIDKSDFYHNCIDPAYRSWMNVIFTLPDEKYNALFLEQAKQAGLTQLKGHKLLGGMRASLYNAMPLAGVEALISFMTEFEMKYR